MPEGILPSADRTMALHHDLQQRLDTGLQAVANLADELADQPDALLALLRQLEHLHRTIQDGPFRNSLPADRNHLFTLLRQMEQSGGWPYIPRLQLRTFMDLLQREPAGESSGLAPLPEGPPPGGQELAA